MGQGVSEERATASEASIPEFPAELFRNDFDWKAALARNFGTDDLSLHQITSIIEQFEEADAAAEQHTKRLVVEAMNVLERAAKAGDEPAADMLEQIRLARDEQDFADRACEDKGKSKAASWLESSLRKGMKDLEAATANKARKQVELQQIEARKVAEHSALEAKRLAVQEMDARQALREDAADEIEARLEDADKAKLRMYLQLQGLKALTPPQQPLLPDSSVAAAKPDPLTQKNLSMHVPELYLVLELSTDATYKEVKQAYRKQALKWHPDKNTDNIVQATERFQRINEAFEVLYDPEKRSQYDTGNVEANNKPRKLQGHGWSNVTDEDDDVLSPLGVRMKKQSWQGYVLEYGRLGDDPAFWTKVPGLGLVFDENHPLAPNEKVKVFWRFLAAKAYDQREAGQVEWMQDFIAKVWKDTPSRWPKGLELQGMSKVAQQEWRERRMVYNRRTEKMLMHLELHEDYLAIPDRMAKEVERIKKMHPGTAKRMSASFKLSCD